MTFPDDVPELTDGEVRLRAHRADDIDGVLAQCRDSEMQRWTTVPVPYRRSDAERFVTEVVPAGWHDGTFRAWAIEYDEGFAGSVDLRGGQARGGEIGFGLGPWARGHNVMERAARLVLDHAFSAWQWDSVVWRAFVGNWASRKVAWKLGFCGIVTVQQAAVVRGRRVDEWVSTLRRDDIRQPRHRWLSAPTLYGERTMLRPLVEEDLGIVAEAHGDALTRHFLPHVGQSAGRADAEVFLARSREQAAAGQRITWVIADRSSGEAVGDLALFRLDNGDGGAEVGYTMHPKARGRGRLTDALRTLASYALGPEPDNPTGLGLRSLLIRTATTNTPSRRAAEKAGFRLRGELRQVSPLGDGTIDDDAIYDLVRDDLR